MAALKGESGSVVGEELSAKGWFELGRKATSLEDGPTWYTLSRFACPLLHRGVNLANKGVDSHHRTWQQCSPKQTCTQSTIQAVCMHSHFQDGDLLEGKLYCFQPRLPILSYPAHPMNSTAHSISSNFDGCHPLKCPEWFQDIASCLIWDFILTEKQANHVLCRAGWHVESWPHTYHDPSQSGHVTFIFCCRVTFISWARPGKSKIIGEARDAQHQL